MVHACPKPTFPDNYTMSALEIIEQIKELPANEQLRVRLGRIDGQRIGRNLYDQDLETIPCAKPS